MNKKLLSVIIPIYKVEQYLGRCFASVIANNDLYEVILVDDGSPDNCPSMCDGYEKIYDFVKVVHKTNGGLSDARNAGLENANGEYVVFLDSDDYFSQDGLENIINELRNADGEDIITCSSIYIYPGNKVKKSFTYNQEILSGIQFLELQYSKRTMQIAAWQNIYKRSFLKNNKLYFKKGILHEDVQWTPRVFYLAKRVKMSNICAYMYEIRENSISTAKDLSKNVFDYKNTIIELVEFFTSIKDTQLFRLIKDDLIMGYLSLYARGNMYCKGDEYKLSRRIVSSDLAYIQTKTKAFLYSWSPRLFTLIMKTFVLKS